MRLWRPGQSLAGVVNSADKPDPISLGRLRLPVSSCPAASGLQIGLQNRLLICSSLTPLRPSMAAIPGRGTMSGLAKRLPSGTASTRDASPPVVPDVWPRRAPVVITATGSAPGTDRAAAWSRPLPEPGCCRS
jgi:hypothetical protein